MRTLQPEWHCDPETNKLHVSATVKNEPYKLSVQIKSIRYEIERITKYLEEISNEVIDESTHRQDHVSIVS